MGKALGDPHRLLRRGDVSAELCAGGAEAAASPSALSESCADPCAACGSPAQGYERPPLPLEPARVRRIRTASCAFRHGPARSTRWPLFPRRPRVDRFLSAGILLCQRRAAQTAPRAAGSHRRHCGRTGIGFRARRTGRALYIARAVVGSRVLDRDHRALHARREAPRRRTRRTASRAPSRRRAVGQCRGERINRGHALRQFSRCASQSAFTRRVRRDYLRPARSTSEPD